MYLSRRAATLAEDLSAYNEADLEAINAQSATPLDWNDVFVRSMYLCSDQPCETDWSRFTLRALRQIAWLVVGQSVISGHDRRSLPLARFFKASIVKRSTGDADSASNWVRAWFYWLRETSGATDLLLNIDGGIYREVSIAWRYRHWQCSICGQEDGMCRHRPGELVGTERCLRVIDEVIDVLEGSLVYKGADPGATLARSLGERRSAEDEAILCLWAGRNDLFDLLAEQNLLGEVSIATPDTLEALHGGALQIWVEDLQGLARAGCEPIGLLAPGGVLLTREANGSGEDCPAFEQEVVVERETAVDGSALLVIQRPQ